MSSGPSRAASAAICAAFALLAAHAAVAQVMYKWIDAQGKTQYSDRPPKGFAGEVTRIQADPEPAVVPWMPPKPAAPPAATEGPAEATPPPEDMNSRRKGNRERLETRLERARNRLEAARRALEEAPGPGIDERQVIQQKVQGGAAGTMHAMAPRINCRDHVDAGGRKSVICPTVMPGDAYYERMASLELAVKQAEEELEAAERAYRRGRD